MDDVNIGECFIEDRLVRQREVEIEPLGNRSHDGDVMLGHIECYRGHPRQRPRR